GIVPWQIDFELLVQVLVSQFRENRHTPTEPAFAALDRHGGRRKKGVLVAVGQHGLRHPIITHFRLPLGHRFGDTLADLARAVNDEGYQPAHRAESQYRHNADDNDRGLGARPGTPSGWTRPPGPVVLIEFVGHRWLRLGGSAILRKRPAGCRLSS